MNESIDESRRLFERYCADDSQAAELLFRRYVSQLPSLVRARMSPALALRLDAEDVVQSAYRTFFTRAKEGAFELKRGGDLWRLLAAISVKKLGKQIERNVAAKRAISAEGSMADLAADLAGESGSIARSKELTPDEEVSIREEIELLMSGLDEVQRQMVEMRLAGYRLEEIATETQRSERTVRRLLEKIKVS